MATFISVTYAKKLFKVTERDIANLPYFSKSNPYYWGAAPMRLYNIRDVVNVAFKKRLRNLDVDKNKASDIVNEFRPQAHATHGQFVLPPDVLNNIMGKVAEGYCANDLRDVKVVAQELSLLGMVCKDFYIACQHGFRVLADLLQEEDVLIRNIDWDRFVSAPQTMSTKECRDIARALDIKVGGTKPQVVLRAFAFFGMSMPRNVPARIVLEMKNYHDAKIDHIKKLVSGLRIAGVKNLSTKNIRSPNLRFFVAQEFETIEHLQQAYNRAMRQRRAIEIGLAALQQPSQI
jgi:hypothetical protein